MEMVFTLATTHYLLSVIVNFSVCSFLLSVQLCPLLPPASLIFPQEPHPSWILTSMWFCKWEVHDVLTDIHTELHTHSHIQAQIRHLYEHTEHMQSCGCKTKNGGLNWQKWIGQIFIFMYRCIFLPHFGLGWYSVVQCCITLISLTKGKSCSFIF